MVLEAVKLSGMIITTQPMDVEAWAVSDCIIKDRMLSRRHG